MMCFVALGILIITHRLVPKRQQTSSNPDVPLSGRIVSVTVWRSWSGRLEYRIYSFAIDADCALTN